jgi:hypothetical protein
MANRFGVLALLFGLTACGGYNADGTVATGPLGQKPLLTKEVQAVTRQGLNACANAVAGRASLANLQSQGFVPWRGGYRKKLDNPLVFGGGSAVSAKMSDGGCVVSTGPAYPIELSTVMSLTQNTLNTSGSGLSAKYRERGDKIDILISR